MPISGSGAWTGTQRVSTYTVGARRTPLASDKKGQQFYQSASTLEMDLLCSHHLVSCTSSGTDSREINPFDRMVSTCVEVGWWKVVPETCIPVILKFKAQR